MAWSTRKLARGALRTPLFERHGHCAAGPSQIADLLEADVEAMRERAARFASRQRSHAPTAD